jgi:hypothetical protein
MSPNLETELSNFKSPLPFPQRLGNFGKNPYHSTKVGKSGKKCENLNIARKPNS